MIGTILTHYMTLQQENDTVIQQHLPCRLDPANIPWNMEVGGLVPTDWFDLRVLNRVQPLPVRGDYFVDEATNTKYQVFGDVVAYVNRIQCRVSRYSGTTP
jgi:hypothetical protein